MAWREALMLCGASAALNWSKPSHAQLSPKARNLWEPAAVLRSVLIIVRRRFRTRRQWSARKGIN